MTQCMLFDPAEIAGAAKKQNAVAVNVKNKKGRYLLGKRLDRCRQVIGSVSMGDSIHYASMGEWSLHDIIVHMLEQTGPADVDICTWSVSEDAVRVMLANIESGLITGLRMLLDWRVRVRRPEVMQLLSSQLRRADIRLTNAHAKVATIINDDWSIAIVGSANLTNNHRIEVGVVCCSEQAADFHRGWMSEELLGATPFEEG